MRIDKWLWCVRAFKTRTLASDACKGGLAKLANENVKPAKELKIGDKIQIRRGIMNWELEVKDFPKNRVAAKQVEEYVINHTPAGEYEKARLQRQAAFVVRDAGAGRPTKKDRRDIDNFSFFEWLEEEEGEA